MEEARSKMQEDLRMMGVLPEYCRIAVAFMQRINDAEIILA
ncbi:MAG: hypothetical protein AAB071_07705 [Bacteroidota bacterium]